MNTRKVIVRQRGPASRSSPTVPAQNLTTHQNRKRKSMQPEPNEGSPTSLPGSSLAGNSIPKKSRSQVNCIVPGTSTASTQSSSATTPADNASEDEYLDADSDVDFDDDDDDDIIFDDLLLTEYEQILLLEADANGHQGGLDYGQIDRLPVTMISKSRNDVENECQVCRDVIKVDQVLRMIPCLHRFHINCLDQWLLIKASCPVCCTPVEFNDNN